MVVSISETPTLLSRCKKGQFHKLLESRSRVQNRTVELLFKEDFVFTNLNKLSKASNLYKQSKDEVVARMKLLPGRILDKYINFEAVTFEAIFNDESFKEYIKKMEGLKT
ncbi:hypothetical protein LWI29_034785 [Acer saccharum]|uniref:Uncharacterized protein n=1 Tax=Acer saccharum TaxID=4024 RepID=A0AA39VTQ2_ACESA|nr:hypothetical protein LWI29_034785 [Acer saccharum]